MVVSTSRQQPISERLRTVHGIAVLSKRSLAHLSMDAPSLFAIVCLSKLLEMRYGCDEHHIFLLGFNLTRAAVEAAVEDALATGATKCFWPSFPGKSVRV